MEKIYILSCLIVLFIISASSVDGGILLNRSDKNNEKTILRLFKILIKSNQSLSEGLNKDKEEMISEKQDDFNRLRKSKEIVAKNIKSKCVIKMAVCILSKPLSSNNQKSVLV